MDLTSAAWRKASYSSSNGGACVEVASNLPGVIAVRDSKNPDDGAALVFPACTFAALTAGIKSGKFDL